MLMKVYRREHHPCLFPDYRERAEYFTIIYNIGRASQVALVVKNLPANAGDLRDAVSIPGLGRCPGGGHSNPLQYFCLENSMDRGVWRANSPWCYKESDTTEWLTLSLPWKHSQSVYSTRSFTFYQQDTLIGPLMNLCLFPKAPGKLW